MQSPSLGPIWLPALLAVVILLQGCSDTPAQEQIKAHINQLADAIETKQPDEALALIHENFVSEKGQDKKWVKRTLLIHTIRHDKIQLVLSNIHVELKDPQTALATFHVIATGGKGLIPDQGSAYKMHTEWRTDSGDWRLVYTKWDKLMQP